MRIAFVSTMGGFPWGGSEELWARTASLALDQGHTILISIYNWGSLHPDIEKLVNKGAQLHLRQLPRSQSLVTRIYRKFSKKILTKSLLSNVLVKFKAHIICISNGGTYDVLFDKEVTQAINTLNIPYITISQFNEEHYCINNQLYSTAIAFFQKAHKSLFVSHRNLQVACRQLAMNIPRAQVVSNPVNLTDYSYIEISNITPIQLACVARFECRCKGQDILLEVLSGEAWQNRDWHLNFYGKGPDEQYLKDLVMYYGLQQRVYFNGYISDIRELWSKNHILLMPSLSEGTPLSLMEAMICGRPSVVTDVGGNTELIEEGITGFIAEAASVNSFGSALERAWNNKYTWREMGYNANKVANQKIDFSTEQTVLNLIVN